MRDRLDYWLESRHPNLALGYKVASRKNPRYNCVALAAGDCKWWWEPADEPGYFWPKEKVPMIGTVENYVRVFELLGYTVCDDASLTPGFEKVAIYQSDDGEFTHVAKQLPNGLWKSKLGGCEDIEHKTPEALADALYGAPVIYLRRRLTIWIKAKNLIAYLWCMLETVMP